MQNQTENLWPEGIADITDQVAPVTYLKQQASLLGARTNNLVEAEVETKTTDYQRFLQHSFYLVAPALDFYKYLLFEIEHPATKWYPLEIVMLPLSTNTLDEQEIRIKIDSEAEFLSELKKVFSSEETKRIVQSLVAQSQK